MDFIIPSPTYSYNTKLYGFDQILNFYNTGRFDTQLDCQRGLVWTEQQKQDMIDTIVRRERIPEFHVIKEDYESIFHFADGKQRITTSTDFLTNKLAWYKRCASPDFYEFFGKRSHIYFSDLGTEWQNAILNSELQFACYKNMTPRSITTLFRKLNSGQPLSKTAKFLAQNITLKKYYLDALMNHPVCAKLFSKADLEKDDAELIFIRLYLLLKSWHINHFHTKLDLRPDNLEACTVNVEIATDLEIDNWINELTYYKEIVKNYLDIFNSFKNDLNHSLRSTAAFQIMYAIYFAYAYNFSNEQFEELYRFLLTQTASMIVGSGADYGPTNLKKYINYIEAWLHEKGYVNNAELDE